MNSALFLKELYEVLSQKLYSESLFKEMGEHTNTRSLFASDFMNNLNLVEVLEEIVNGAEDEAKSSSNTMFLRTAIQDLFTSRSMDVWL